MKINNVVLRILTSLVAVAVLAGVWIFFPVRGMFLLVSALTAGLIWEYYKLAFCKLSSQWFPLFFVLFCFFSYLFFLFSGKWLAEAFIFTVFLFFVFSFWILHRHERENIFQGISYGLISLFYISLPTALFLRIFSNEQNGSDFLFLFLCIVFLGDIFAYLGGSFLGGKKWMPSISPRKTWCGLLCGLLMSAVVSGLGFYLKEDFSFSLFFLFGAVSFFIAQTGDLFVSLLKRQAGVKDSGFFLPGHGGLLDRLDGFLLALPFMYIFVFEIYYFL